jgi:alpha-N-acetylglucosaminidase
MFSEVAFAPEQLEPVQWFEDWARRRYDRPPPAAVEAWRLLYTSGVYNCNNSHENHNTDFTISRPRLCNTIGDQAGWSDGHIDGSWPNWNDSHTYPDNSSHWITYSWAGGPFHLNEYHPWYDTSEFLQAWRLLLNASDDLSDQQPYVWDVVDVTREVLSKFVFTFYVNATTNAYLAKDVHALSKAGDALLELMDDLDDLLGSCEGWLLGAWIADARANAMGEPAPTRAVVADRWEYNARLLITTWGGGISDYANKFWSGLIGDYYKGRWERWLAMLADNLRNDIPLSYHDHGLIDQAWTEEWTANRSGIYPTTPSGIDSVALARKLAVKYMDMLPKFERCPC